MMAKIVKGSGFSGAVNYILDKEKKAFIIDAEGLRLKDTSSIIQSFIMQAELNPKLIKTVGHISLNFSAQDKSKLTDIMMVKIAREYMQKMGIVNTQYFVAIHFDKEHPHMHLCFNRVGNDGKTISDNNDRIRSEKICKELTEKYDLYFAKGKENVKTNRLKEPDKTKYEIYGALQKQIPRSQNWQDLIKKLSREGITVQFKNKGNSNEVQGVIFKKNGYSFNGSKVDRAFSYSKINYQLSINTKAMNQKEGKTNNQTSFNQNNNQSAALLENVLLSGLSALNFNNPESQADDEEYLRRLRKKKKQYKPKM